MTDNNGATALLEFRKVNTHYGAVHILKDVDLAIYPGELVCLLGGNASGKSTTLKAIVQHMRFLFQEEEVDASVELTAYTGVAAFNIGFGARTACTSFRVFPKTPWEMSFWARLLGSSSSSGAVSSC